MTDIPSDLIVPRGALRLSPRMLSLCRDFAVQYGLTHPHSRNVTAISWAERRSYRLADESDWVDQGPGFDLGGMERRGLPAHAIHVFEGVEIFLQIPSVVWRASEERMIDVEERNGMTEVVLR
jgi:hypothetical protein